MKVNETITLTLDLPRPSDTVPIWTANDTSVCLVEPNDGGYSAKVTALANGVAEIDVRANCDLGSGTREHHVTFPIIVDGQEEVIVPVQSKEEPTSKYWAQET